MSAVSDDEAVRRGVEAGWALRQALNDLCGDRSQIAIKAAVAVMTLDRLNFDKANAAALAEVKPQGSRK